MLHLGDFIYEVVWYPEDRPQGTLRAAAARCLSAIPNGEKIARFPRASDARGLSHDLSRLSAGSRSAGRARALAVRLRLGQSRVLLAGLAESAGVRRRDATGADEEGRGEPGVVRVSAGARREARRRRLDDRFEAPHVEDTADRRRSTSTASGLEPNNLAAIGSLKIYRALRLGRNVDLILTDNHSYRGRAARPGRRSRRRSSAG